MVKTDRTSAPLGLALLFLSLAIVPVTLRIAGYEVSVSPSLSAAIEAWRSVAGVLGNSSQPISDTELSLVKKYSFAEGEEVPAQEQMVADAASTSFEPEYEPNIDPTWEAREASSLAVVQPTVETRSCPKYRRQATAANQVASVRWSRRLASSSLIRAAVVLEIKRTKCVERQAALLRVRELMYRSRALSELLRTVEVNRDEQVFVKMEPIALFSGTPCDPELTPIGEPSTEVFRNGGVRFGVGASEEPESFEFWEDPGSFEFWF